MQILKERSHSTIYLSIKVAVETGKMMCHSAYCLHLVVLHMHMHKHVHV